VITAITVITDVSYAPAVGRAHLMDIYLPSTGSGPYPVVMYHGGSAFRSDDTKSRGRPPGGGLPPPNRMPPAGVPFFSDRARGGKADTSEAAALAERWAGAGYSIVAFNVRSSAQATFPAQVHDVKAAIRFLRANANQYDLDPNRIGVMGTSSGGWVASMAGLTGHVSGLAGDLGNPHESSAVQAVVDLFGPSDFLTMDAQRIPGGQEHNPPGSPESALIGCAVQECPDQARAASPVSYVDEHSPPFYISHGTDDPAVPCGQSVELFEQLAEAGGDASLTLVPRCGHTDAYLSSASMSPGYTVTTASGGKKSEGPGPPPTYETLLAFFDRCLHAHNFKENR
jgi:acetyl esterase/lipase